MRSNGQIGQFNFTTGLEQKELIVWREYETKLIEKIWNFELEVGTDRD